MDRERAVSVSEAMAAAKRALEKITLTVVGEVSEFSDKPGYRAAYFTVADRDASMSCLMWRDAYLASGVTLRCGMLVEMTGQFSAYAPKGRMQFVVRRLALAGEGKLRLQVAETARRLEAEGLLRDDRKRSLPEYPMRIGVVTSPRGKAVHDVIRTLARRYPVAEVLVAGVTVEGTDAVPAILEGLTAVAQARADVVLLVRGGGSYEDLMPFNDERLARAIAASPVPVVSGIGHEPDTTIADFVADVRASTPTAAAEASTPAVSELAGRLEKLSRLLGRALEHRVRNAEHRVRLLSTRPLFCEPDTLLGQAGQAVDSAARALGRAIPVGLARDAARLSYAEEGLMRAGPRIVERPADATARLAGRLNDLSPLAILGRGYAVCFAADGSTVVRSVSEVSVGEVVEVRVHDGRLGCIVERIEEGR